jgi:hypothetical protein
MVCRENVNSNKLIILYLSTFDDQGQGFFSNPPLDLYRNSNAYQALKTNLEALTGPDVFISVLVEAVRTGNSESDRVYRILDSYQNNF